MDYAKEALRLHAQWNGKLETVPKMKLKTEMTCRLLIHQVLQSHAVRFMRIRLTYTNIPGKANTVVLYPMVRLYLDLATSDRRLRFQLWKEVCAVQTVCRRGCISNLSGYKRCR